MEHVKTFKVVLKPKRAQQARIDQWINTCRCVYNIAKEVKETAYRKGVTLSKYDLIKMLPDLKKDYYWIKDVDSQALQAVVERLDRSYQNFFNGAGYPNWANRYNYYSFLCKKGHIISTGLLSVPKLGNISFKDTWGLNQSLKIRTVTIKREQGRYFACITAEVHIEKLLYKNNSIGIDLGVHSLIADSNGQQTGPSIRYEGYCTKLRLLQRKLSRQVKGGSNRKKTKRQIARLHYKISSVRIDHLQKLSSSIINENQVIVMEALKVKNMSKSVRGSLEKPGVNVKAKAGLNRSILNSSFGHLRRLIAYKAEWYGRELILVDPKNTSRTCHCCGHISAKNRKGKSFRCVSCDHRDDADINAAKNILEKGILHRPQGKAVA